MTVHHYCRRRRRRRAPTPNKESHPRVRVLCAPVPCSRTSGCCAHGSAAPRTVRSLARTLALAHWTYGSCEKRVCETKIFTTSHLHVRLFVCRHPTPVSARMWAPRSYRATLALWFTTEGGFSGKSRSISKPQLVSNGTNVCRQNSTWRPPPPPTCTCTIWHVPRPS